jgi:hypothetical protein
MAPIPNRHKGKVWLYCRNLESIQQARFYSKPISNEILASWPESEIVVNETNGFLKAFQDFCSNGIVHVFTEQF